MQKTGQAPSGQNDKNWWRQAVVYQIYPRSYADSNADGIGDLKGVTSRIDYLQSLNIDAIWLSPFYPSPLVDGGYDVSDYRNVDPKLGTLADFDEMLAALHNVGIRIFVDIVPNHCSHLHQWFQDALAAPPHSPERNRFIFRDGRGEDKAQPPTDWVSHFAPSAWTHESTFGGVHNQWFLHYFAPEQPDWNWDNPEIAEDFLKTLKFWADRGVDGFRIDVAHGLKKDLSEPFRMRNTLEHEIDRPTDGNGILADRNEVFDVYKQWRKLFNQYDPPKVAVAEANVLPERIPLYASEETLGQCFDFRFIFTPFNAQAYKENVTEAIELAKINGSSCTWCLSNHDQIRHATKFGLDKSVDRRLWMLSDGKSAELDRETGTKRALAATLFILALPGSTYLYQGEELGLHEVTDIPESMIQDPQYLKNLKFDKGRDGCRVPLPWEANADYFGFSTGGSHLPQPSWFKNYAVDMQFGKHESSLSIYQEALRIRKDLMCEESMTWHETGDPEVLHFSRPNGWNCLINFEGDDYLIPNGDIILSSTPIVKGRLPAGSTLWIQR